MSTPFELAKLAELRAKTDRQLIRLIDDEVERGLNLARLHRNTHSAMDWDSAKWHRAKAERAYAEAAKLLPTVYSLSEPERHRLQVKLRKLKGALAEWPQRAGAEESFTPGMQGRVQSASG